MLPHARYDGEEDLHSDEEEVEFGLTFFTSPYTWILTTFTEKDYEGEFVEIGKYLRSL